MSARKPLTGVILDEQVSLTIHEVCAVCGVEEAIVVEMVSEGVAEPLDAASATLEFSGIAAARLIKAHRLQRDLHVNLAGAVLALELLDEISTLRARRHR